MDFLSSQGIPKLLTSILTTKRPADLAYFWLTVTLDGKDVDAEVTKDAVTLQFCLKLPQTFFGDGATADEEIEDMVRDYRSQKKANERKDEAENEEDTEKGTNAPLSLVANIQICIICSCSSIFK